MHNKARKHQALYQSNIDYDATYMKGLGHPRIKSIDQTRKGHIYIKFKDREEVSTLISPRGTIQVSFSTLGELNACLNFLREVLVPKFGEGLFLTPKGTYTLIDKIRYLIQEGKITHEMGLDLGRLAELTGREKEDIRSALPAILQEILPFGIELKVSKVLAGCSRAESYVEEWLGSVEQALRREGFYSPYSFEWEPNQSFEFVKHVDVDVNCEGVICVKAFLDGRVITEADPTHLTRWANRIVNDILDKYAIPYETKIPVKTAKGPWIPVVVLGIAALGAIHLYRLSNIGSETLPKNEKNTCPCDC